MDSIFGKLHFFRAEYAALVLHRLLKIVPSHDGRPMFDRLPRPSIGRAATGGRVGCHVSPKSGANNSACPNRSAYVKEVIVCSVSMCILPAGLRVPARIVYKMIPARIGIDKHFAPARQVFIAEQRAS